MLFHLSVNFHDDLIFVCRLVVILVFDFRRYVGTHVASDLNKFYLIGSSCGDLPS